MPLVDFHCSLQQFKTLQWGRLIGKQFYTISISVPIWEVKQKKFSQRYSRHMREYANFFAYEITQILTEIYRCICCNEASTLRTSSGKLGSKMHSCTVFSSGNSGGSGSGDKQPMLKFITSVHTIRQIFVAGRLKNTSCIPHYIILCCFHQGETSFYLWQWCTDSRWLNFIWWHLIFVGRHYGTCLMLPFWHLAVWDGS